MAFIKKGTSDDTRLYLPREVFKNPQKVQGAERREYCGVCLIESPRRFKLFCDGKQVFRILEGSGFIKWTRGEIPFTAGDVFEAENAGEYELNGNCIFIWINGSPQTEITLMKE